MSEQTLPAPAPAPAPEPSGGGGLLRSRRARLVALLLVASVAVTVLAVQAASGSISYYSTPEEIREHTATRTDIEGTQWRVGGRVVGASIVEENGRPVAFDIVGEEGHTLSIRYDGIVPNLFGPQAFVVVEGTVEGPNQLHATDVIIKHENEFVSDAEDASVPVPTPR